MARQFGTPGELPLVRVDVIGVGAGVSDFLRYNNKVECVGVSVATAATGQRGGGAAGGQVFCREATGIPAFIPRKHRIPIVVHDHPQS